MSAIDDFDHSYGKWLKDIVYWWCPGSTCRRFYLLHANEAAIFDDQQRIVTIHWVQSEILYHRISSTETFSLFCTTGVHRNMNLVRTFPDLNDGMGVGGIPTECPYKCTELRVNGNKFHYKYKDTNYAGKPMLHLAMRQSANIENHHVQVNGDKLMTYPWQFGNTFAANGGGVLCRISFSKNGKNFMYRNLFELCEKELKYDHRDITIIHNQALEHTNGWSYTWTGPQCKTMAVIIYETLIGKRDVHILRDGTQGQPHEYIKNLRVQMVENTLQRTKPIKAQEYHVAMSKTQKLMESDDCHVETFSEPLSDSEDEDY